MSKISKEHEEQLILLARIVEASSKAAIAFEKFARSMRQFQRSHVSIAVTVSSRTGVYGRAFARSVEQAQENTASQLTDESKDSTKNDGH